MQRLLMVALAAVTLAVSAPAALAQGIPGRDSDRDRGDRDAAEVNIVGRVERATDPSNFTVAANGMFFRVVARPDARRDLPDIRTGDRVRVRGELGPALRVDADQIVRLGRGGEGPLGGGGRPAVTLVGTVRRMNRQENSAVVAGPSGDVRVEWDENTEFIRDRVRSSPREFRVGDPVRIIGRRTGANEWRARRVVYGGRGGWTSGGVGEIVGIDSRAREVEVDFEGEVWTVRLGSARLSRNNRRLEIDDLRTGQDVRVTGTPRGPRAVEATQVEVLRDVDR